MRKDNEVKIADCVKKLVETFDGTVKYDIKENAQKNWFGNKVLFHETTFTIVFREKENINSNKSGGKEPVNGRKSAMFLNQLTLF